MNIKELLQATPENLAEKQEIALSEAVVARLQTIMTHIKRKEYKFVEKLLAHSDSGDQGNENDLLTSQILWNVTTLMPKRILATLLGD